MSEQIPPHIREMINIGEEIVSSFHGNYKRKSKVNAKNITNCIIVLTNERILINSIANPLDLEKLFLANVFSVDHSKGKNKMKITYIPRGSDIEEEIILEIEKEKGEKKDTFNGRLENIANGLAGFFDSSEAESENDEKRKPQEIPDLIIKPKNPMGLPFAQKEMKKVELKEQIKRFCYNCGEQLPPGGKFCAKCGTKIE